MNKNSFLIPNFLSILVFLGFFLCVNPVLAAPIVPDSFSTTWDTGAATDISINLGICPTAVYWEEIGSSTNSGNSFSCNGSNLTTVNLPFSGEYRIDFSGDFSAIDLGGSGFSSSPEKDKFRSVEQWGISSWGDLSGAFSFVTNLTFNANDVPDLSQTTVMSIMFYQATNFNSDISDWDVSNVTDMWGMFWGASSFNQPLDNWDVSANTRFWRMFREATSFNQPLNNWDVSAGVEFNEMFSGASSFNQSLDTWDLTNAQSMENMFTAATAFNQSIDTWQFPQVTNLNGVFLNASSFNQSLNSWNVSNVTTMQDLFFGASSFNQPLDNWDVSSVTNMGALFRDASSFNQPIDTWDVGSVTEMGSMFYGATAFNQILDSWDVSNVNQFGFMFYEASAFNQPLGSWNISNATGLYGMFDQSALSPENYSAILSGWTLRTLPNSVNFGSVPSAYCDTAQAARDLLVASNWLFTDDGAITCVVVDDSGGGSGGGSTATRVGERLKSFFYSSSTPSTTTTTNLTVTKESFITAVKKFISYLQMNEEDLLALSPEESKNLIIGMRNIVVYLLSLLPFYE